MPILILQHSSLSGPGRLAATLRDHSFRLDIRRLDLHGAAALPPDLDDVQGVVSLGGPQNVGENHDWMPRELELLREAHARQIPVIGICLGAQLIAAALGGKVAHMQDTSEGRSALRADADTLDTPHPRSEWGFRNIAINPIGQVETMLAGIPWNARHFCAHGQEVKELPPESTLLASSELCRVQIFRAGLRTYGFQFHMECDRPMIDALVAGTPESIARSGMSAAQILQEAQQHYADFARIADRLSVNLVTFLFPLHHRLAG